MATGTKRTANVIEAFSRLVARSLGPRAFSAGIWAIAAIAINTTTTSSHFNCSRSVASARRYRKTTERRLSTRATPTRANPPRMVLNT